MISGTDAKRQWLCLLEDQEKLCVVWYGMDQRKKVDAFRLMLQMIDVYCPIETKETVVRDSFFQ